MPSPPDSVTSIPLSQPDLTEREREAVAAVLQSPRLAMGPELDAFEDAMADACGTRHAVGVSSGTAALHCIVRALGLGEGDEVITTPYSFVASSNALLFERATPRFVDVCPDTYNLDVERAEAAITPRTRAILAVDVFGRPANWPALTRLAEQHDLALIDDACEAIGASVGGAPIGSWGDAASFGFYPNKQVTTGEGGCITTDDAELAALCRSLRNQGRADDGRMEHVRLGYNYRLDEMSAALGRVQVERLDVLLDRRRAVARCYHDALAPLAGDLVRPAPSGSESGGEPSRERSWFVYVVRLRDHFADHARDALLEKLQDRGIGCAPYFPAIHLQPYYRERFGYAPGDFPVCEHVAARTFALPFHTALSPDAVTHVATTLTDILPTLPQE
jgi:perosamine synthetase